MGSSDVDVLVIGDGPGGLSAAMFLARGGCSVLVAGQDQTAMHWAMLNNYLGVEPITGTAFQQRARGQVVALGVTIRDDAVVSLVAADQGGFTATLDGGEVVHAGRVVLSEGKKPVLARALGCVEGDRGVQVDGEGQTSVEGVYAVGRMVRPASSQAIISAGDGARAALAILARIQGRPVQDWDSPPKQGEG